MQKILVTAFMPFMGRGKNASEEVLNNLVSSETVSQDIEALVLPTSYRRSVEALNNILSVNVYEAILMLGESKRPVVNVERFAVNFAERDHPDEDGELIRDKVIDETAPAGYFTTLPTRKIVEGITDAGVPATISYTAGTYVCNFTLFNVINSLRETQNTKVGFIHLPLLPECALEESNSPSMSTEISGKAVAAALEVIKRDIA
jgi:pyroglutamyl-peptidase